MAKDKVLTYNQARELKFFCRNVVGTREEFYEVMNRANAFDDRLKRLEKTCDLIEKFLGEKIESLYKSDFFKPEASTQPSSGEKADG